MKDLRLKFSKNIIEELSNSFFKKFCKIFWKVSSLYFQNFDRVFKKIVIGFPKNQFIANGYKKIDKKNMDKKNCVIHKRNN